ncbi:MAG: glycosyltransferase family 2 protein [Phycisphaeraceae bacterium]|nr:glycosyltransferase family 2 protein [Phycisphaeraceae bacterium]
MNADRIVIGVCTYNRGERILRTLRTIAEMDRADGRVTRCVIVDNRSNDGTSEIIDRFIASGPALPMVRVREEKPGKPEALRRFFEETDEPLLGVIDDDCLCDPAWAREILRVFDAQPRAGIVGGPVSVVWESGPTKIARIYKQSLVDRTLGNEQKMLSGPTDFVVGAAQGMRRASVIETGFLSQREMDCLRGERLEAGDDVELCIRARKLGWEVWYTPDAKMGHLIPPSRQTVAYIARLRESIRRSEPWTEWIAGLVDHDRAKRERTRARRLYLKSLFFDWRPARRRVRLAERAGTLRGWEGVCRRMSGEQGV